MDQTVIVAGIVAAVATAFTAVIAGLFQRPKSGAEAKSISVVADKTAAQMWQEWADEQKREAARLRVDLLTERRETAEERARVVEEMQKATRAAERAERESRQCKHRVIQLENVLRENGITVPIFLLHEGEK